MEIINWIKSNYQDLLFIVSGLISVASVVVRLTPTIKDNEILLKVIKFLGKYIALNRNVQDDQIREENR